MTSIHPYMNCWRRHFNSIICYRHSHYLTNAPSHFYLNETCYLHIETNSTSENKGRWGRKLCVSKLPFSTSIGGKECDVEFVMWRHRLAYEINSENCSWATIPYGICELRQLLGNKYSLSVLCENGLIFCTCYKDFKTGFRIEISLLWKIL